MTEFIKFLIIISMIASIHTNYCYADTSADSTEQEGGSGFGDDSAPIINCKTAEQDIATFKKQIADMRTKLLEEEEGIVLPSDYKGDGIMDPEKDIEAANQERQELEAQIAKIKEVCGLA